MTENEMATEGIGNTNMSEQKRQDAGPKYRCIHCGETFNELADTWNHEEENSGHSVWITKERVNQRRNA